MLAAAAAPPIYGFGVDADAGAAKLYVQNRYGEAPPQLPAAAEAAMPPVFSNGTREPPRTLSLEWRVGEATTALRYYGAPRSPRRDRLLAVGGGLEHGEAVGAYARRFRDAKLGDGHLVHRARAARDPAAVAAVGFGARMAAPRCTPAPSAFASSTDTFQTCEDAA